MVSQFVATGMQLEQAVFASSDRGCVKGYQLVSKSAGIGTDVALELTRWAPTQLPSDAPDRGTISAWRLLNGTFAIARTVHGGPEYSNRGGIQVVTMFLLVPVDQMELYDFNPIAVARTAIAFGHLRLPFHMRAENLPTVMLPNQPVFRSITDRQTEPVSERRKTLIGELAELTRISQPFAVTGLSDPIDCVELLVATMSVHQRMKFSFTTGLSPSIRRPLQAHFYRYPDAVRLQTLQSQDIRCLSVNVLSRDG